MADHMLRTKFWSGLKSEYLKSALRSRVEGGEDFDSLLRYARTIEQEVSADSNVTALCNPLARKCRDDPGRGLCQPDNSQGPGLSF